MLLSSRCAGCDRAGEVLCRTCRFALVGATRHPGRGRRPHRVHAASPDVIAALPFSGRAREVLLGFKYRNRRAIAGHLAGLLVNRLLSANGGSASAVEGVDVVTWAPTSAPRRRARGFDQAELVARRVAAQLGLPCRRLLERDGREPAQTGRRRIERRHGVAFRVRPDVAGRRVLVIDDVVTTGSTLHSAAEALRRAGAAEVVLAAVAATPGSYGRRATPSGTVLSGPWTAAGERPERRSA